MAVQDHDTRTTPTPVPVPSGLFSRIMRRLGLEKQLQVVRRNFGWFLAGLFAVTLICAAATLGLRRVLAYSSFGPFAHLIISDPHTIVRYWHPLAFSIAESLPGAWVLFVLVPLAAVLLLARLVSVSLSRWSALTRRIRTNRTLSSHNMSDPTPAVSAKPFVQSRVFMGITVGVATVALAIAIFDIGVVVGVRKATFSYAWGENYHTNFAGPRAGFMGGVMDDFMGAGLIEGHGVSGRILKVDASSGGQVALVMQGMDNVERIVIAGDDTEVRYLDRDGAPNDIQDNDFAVVIGEPNDAGQIEAKFIRIVPEQAELPTSPQLPYMMMR